MMHTDPPRHTRYRRLVQPGFKPTMVRLMEAGVTAKARALIDTIEARRAGGHRARPCPSPSPCRSSASCWASTGRSGRSFFDWSEAVIPGESERTESERAELQAEMWGYLVGVAEERRAEPAEDLVSVLATVGSEEGADGDRLSEPELAMFLIQLLVAGNETTRNLISAGLAALAAHPDQWAALRADPASDPERRGGTVALDDAGHLVHAHGDRRLHRPGPGRRRGRPAAPAVRVRQPRRGGVRPRRRPAPRRPPPQPARELRLRPALLPRGRAGPLGGARRAQRASGRASRR